MSLPPRRRTVIAAPSRKVVELRGVRLILEPDLDADASYLEQPDFKARRAEYKRGAFTLMVARAEADVVIADVPQVLESAGLGGIESDTDEETLAEIFASEWMSLRDVLKQVGVSTSELPLEVKPEWIERRT